MIFSRQDLNSIPSFQVENYEYRIAFSAWGYSLKKFVPRTISFESSRKNKLLFKELILNNTLRTMNNIPGGYRDEIFFVGQISAIKEFSFLGQTLLRIVLEFDERVLNMRFPLFINKKLLAESYQPQVGDVVSGTAWLQGRVLTRLLIVT